jgi:hypothetical protein
MGGGDPDLTSRKGLGINRRTVSWNVAGATFAYAFGELTKLDYKYVGMDQLIGGGETATKVIKVHWVWLLWRRLLW